MGKPPLDTETKAMEMFGYHVSLGSGKQDYISLAEKALEENSKELEKARIEFAKSHTWENNVLNIYDAIKKSTQHRLSWD